MALSSLIVGISDCKVTRDAESVLVTYALGSCIAVAMHDPVTKVSGLLHYMLPESAIDASKAQQNPFMFADTGIPRLMDSLKAAGGEGKRMVVQLTGGAAVLDSQGVFQIGKRNYLAARKILWKAGILIAAEAVGGEVSRTTRLEVGTGRLWVREGGGIERELVRKQAAPKAVERQ
ncbi:MAG TPA: chemotaxis protein CheD [Bryobacteraceae bacterium]|jgi:chemotaxis protein CheD|nr:chemotaxis protein CheD [Bryobacteraceae bacterium]